ncbi:hypothetical protein GF380_00665 [Candidatus Uhrbacteria bacterium]|nr:hypothetical protein [Candidatus Uhrbacteria bacterium]
MDEILLTDELLASEVSTDYTFIVILVVGLFVLFGFIILIMMLRRILHRPELHGLTREQIKRKWDEVEKIAHQGMMGMKMGIVEADNLLDGCLKSMMIPGETMGERLRVAGYKYPELKKVWFAHKLRNQIVHESTFQISKRQGQAAIHEYRRALKLLNVL